MPIKAVFDTNVWVSALRNPGPPRKIVNSFASTNRVELYCAAELLDELIKVLQRPKFIEEINGEEARHLIELIQKRANFVQISYTPTVSIDPKDNKVLACAAISQSDFLVTGDKKHLLILGQYEQTKIVSPAQFLEILERQS